MQDDANPKGMKGTLNQHWEKIGLGVAVLGLVAFLGLSLGTKIPEVASLDKVIDDVRARESGASKEIAGPSALAADRKDSNITSAAPAPGFAGSVRTEYKATINPKLGEKGQRIAVSGARLEEPVVTPEGISLILTLDTPPAASRDPLYFPPTLFIVERKSGKTDWAAIGEPIKVGKETKELKFIDAKVAAKTEYSYRVKPDSDDPKWKDPKASGSVPKPVKDPVKYSNIVSAISSDIWTISFSSPNQAAEDSGLPNKVYVTIEKFDPEFGLVRAPHIHAEGEKIGFWAEGAGEPTSKHKVSSSKVGRMVEVDFDTKCELKKITFGKKVDYLRERCKTKATGTGLECDGKESVKESFTATEILYLNEDKKPVAVYLGGVKKSNELCEQHGGVKKPVMTDEEKKEKRRLEAIEALAAADALWNTKKEKPKDILSDRRSAQKKYKDLLAEYAEDVDEVKKRKPEIEEKLKMELK